MSLALSVVPLALTLCLALTPAVISKQQVSHSGLTSVYLQLMPDKATSWKDMLTGRGMEAQMEQCGYGPEQLWDYLEDIMCILPQTFTVNEAPLHIHTCTLSVPHWNSRYRDLFSCRFSLTGWR